MPDVLLVYASTHGHTARIAAPIAEALGGAGHSVDLRSVDEAGDVRAGEYEGVIVGGSVHAGHHQRALLDWVKGDAGELQGRRYAVDPGRDGDFTTRLLMRLLMRRGHHPTDASRDYDYTDWAAVDRFAHDCVTGL